MSAFSKILVNSTAGAANFDIHCIIEGESKTDKAGQPQAPSITVSPGNQVIVRTGLAVEVPPGWVLAIYSRSGHGFKDSVRLSNAVGQIDSDYRQEVMVALHNDSNEERTVRHGDRVAQLVLLPFLPYLIKGGEGIEHITLIYMIYVLGSASSYLLSYKNSIYQAYQKGYICAGWSMACECIKTVSQITVLLLTRNFILYLAVQQAIQFLPNIMVSRMVDKEFPYLKECHELPEREERNGILKNIGAMSMHKLSTIIVRNTDKIGRAHV